MQYYIKWRGKIDGPLSESEVGQKIRRNEISRVALVSDDRTTWKALAKTEIYKRITEEATAKVPPSKPDPVKISPSTVPVPEPASAEEEDEAPVMARQFALRPPMPSHGPSFEELRRGYYPAQTMAGSPSQPFNNYGRSNPAHRYDLHDNSDVSVRSRVAYQWLGFFFGMYGIHNFYAGRIDVAIIQLVLSLIITATSTAQRLGIFGDVSFVVFWSALVVSFFVIFWVWIDIFTVDKDSENRDMPGQSIAGMLLLFTVVLIVLLGVLVALLMNTAANVIGI